MVPRLTRMLALVAIAALPGLSSVQARETGQAAILRAPAAKERLIAHGLPWRCYGVRCTAPTGDSRPLVFCQALTRVAGPVVTFASEGKTLTENEIAQCNRSVGPAPDVPEK
ncbi:MAG: hypothetical protein J0I80_15385 [Sphingomonas sp.]|nr:hypothetical protein [Sphingomonas sp.]